MNTLIASPHTSNLSIDVSGFLLLTVFALFIGYLLFLVVLQIDEYFGKIESKQGKVFNVQICSNRTDVYRNKEIYAPFLLSTLRSDIFVNVISQEDNKLVCFTLSKNNYPLEMKEDDTVAYLQKTGRLFKRIRYSNCHFIR